MSHELEPDGWFTRQNANGTWSVLNLDGKQAARDPHRDGWPPSEFATQAEARNFISALGHGDCGDPGPHVFPAAAPLVEQSPATEPECPGEDCPYCSGEACRQCQAPSEDFPCEHDGAERHMESDSLGAVEQSPSDPNKETRMEIQINGVTHDVPNVPLDYAELLRLAEETDGATVVYHGQRSGDSQRSGTVHRNQSVQPDAGMRFTIIHTGSA